MKVKVKSSFRDKNTRKVHRVGEFLNISEERYKEIMSKGELLEKVEEETGKTQEDAGEGKTAQEEMKAHFCSEDLKEWKLPELRKLAKDMNLDDKGKKEELIERICEAEVYVGEREEEQEEVSGEESEG